VVAAHTYLFLGALVVLASVAVAARAVLLVRELQHARRRAEHSERRFRMVFERSPIGISVGRDGIMSETNPALQRMLGYTSAEFAGMHYSAVTHPDDRELDMQIQLDTGVRDAFSMDKRYIAKDGRAIEMHVHVALDLEDGLGISLMEDVTRQRELEDQLRQAQKLEAVGKLAGGIAHDFNNLMTAVLGYSDLVLQGLGPDDPDRARLEAIKDAAVRASNLTRQLLAFGRRQVLQAADVDLCDVVARMSSVIKGAIGQDILLETVLATDEVVVRVDPTQLEQVVMNLAVNARDAMPNGGVLRIGVSSAGNWAVLSVEDTGEGMDPMTQERIFEPFFTTKGVGDGSGLGLSTVHGIVGQSGGQVGVDSAPGQGTRFTIRLPLMRQTAALPQAAAVATLLTD
jgi:PAS domain S-box-containing protein